MSVEPATQREEASRETCPRCGSNHRDVYGRVTVDAEFNDRWKYCDDLWHYAKPALGPSQRAEASRDTTDCPECPTYFPKGHSHYHTFPGPSLPEEAAKPEKPLPDKCKEHPWAPFISNGTKGWICFSCWDHQLLEEAESTNASLRRRVAELEGALRGISNVTYIEVSLDEAKIDRIDSIVRAALAAGETEGELILHTCGAWHYPNQCPTGAPRK